MKYLTFSLETEEIREAFIEFLPFFEAMAKEMTRHQPEKGDSWKTMRLEDLEDLYIEATRGKDVHFLVVSGENTSNQIVDVGNLGAMYWLRLKEMET